VHLQVLSSGSDGNAALVRAGETHLLLDAGLPLDELEERLAAARVAPRRLDHIALTHGHLDHARSAGALAKKADARVHCAENAMRNASLKGAPRLAALPIGGEVELRDARGADPVRLRAVPVPHDADPTVAFRVEAEERVLVLVTDMGRPDADVAKRLAGAHVLLLEFNHDAELLRRGPYPATLRRRVGGPRGHLSNAEAGEMLRLLAGPELHTLVLTHLSRTNNTPALARAAAEEVLAALDRTDVRILIAAQDAVGENLKV
jgi:phosphoribosyl 1,2-cyclic phosphodiesterase